MFEILETRKEHNLIIRQCRNAIPFLIVLSFTLLEVVMFVQGWVNL